jgi:hypothetical protein
LYSSGKQTYIQLAEQFRCSTKTIQRMLDKAPIDKRKEFSCVAVIIMDTTYFGRGFGVMVFKNSLDGMVLYKQYVGYETNALYLAGISEIRRRGLLFNVLFAMAGKDYLGYLVIFPYKCASSIRYR